MLGQDLKDCWGYLQVTSVCLSRDRVYPERHKCGCEFTELLGVQAAWDVDQKHMPNFSIISKCRITVGSTLLCWADGSIALDEASNKDELSIIRTDTNRVQGLVEGLGHRYPACGTWEAPRQRSALAQE